MRIGLFGGTFDPPHVGHLMVAQIAREMAQLDRVVFIPAAIPPHKQHQDITNVESRLAMVAMAVKPFSSFEVSPIECQREGPSYTVDTVLAYRKLYPFAELFLILGADMFENFPTWKDAQEIAKEVTLLVAPRPYQDVDQAISKGQMTLSASQIIILEMPALDISSSWLRERLVAGLRVDPLLPDGVWNWIVQQGVYQQS